MTVTGTSQGLGAWSIRLRPDTPLDILNGLQYFGHIAVSTGRPDPRVSGDSLLTSSRYVGVLRKVTVQGEGYSLSGSGMAYWIGDEGDKGAVITTQLLFTGTPFTTAISSCLASTSAVTAGTLHAVTGSYVGFHQNVTVRKAISFICSTLTADTTDPVEWRVNGDGTLDAGLSSQLYVTTPQAAIVRRHVGSDMGVRALPGKAVTDEDVQDFTTDVVILAQGEGLSIATGAATIAGGLNPYKDIHGNPVKVTRTVSQSSTAANSANAQAAIILAQYGKPRDAVRLTTDQFDIEGDLSVGDSVWVHDPTAGLVDTSVTPNELVFRGERINPIKLRVYELTWPIAPGMSVAYRDPNGAWVDLTDYLVFESGATSVVVGGYDRSLINPTGVSEVLGSRGAPNTSVPAAPAFATPFVQAVYQSPNSGVTKAQVQVAWTAPLNTDGTAILDGDHYEIRYRTSDHPIFPSTWAQLAGKTWAQLATQTWEQPIGYVAGPWTIAYSAFDTTSHLIQELTPGVPYDFQIRAVDNGNPPNYGAWSSTTSIQTNADTIAPATPAAPSVASSLIAVQVTHTLGASSGGTFNLAADLDHLEIHAQYEPTFTPDETTLLGKLRANNGMILSQTPVVGTFQIASTVNVYVKVVAVDEAGNASSPSVAVQSSAQLIDDSHISNLTVSKLLAGTVVTDWLVGANIQTAPSGTRAGLNANGLFAYSGAAKSWEVQAATGDMISYAPTGLRTMRSEAATGNVYLYKNDGTTVALQLTASTGTVSMVGALTVGDQMASGDRIEMTNNTGYPTMFFYDSTSGSNRAYINAVVGGGRMGLGMNSGVDSSGNQTTLFLNPSSLSLFYNTFTGTPNLQRGGGLELDDTSAFLNYAPSATTISSVTCNTNGIQLYASAATKEVYSAIAMGTNGGGFAQKLQNGASPGVRGYYNSADNTMRFLDNQSGGTWMRLGDGSGVYKNFVIDHPTDPLRWLVHACTEAPEAAVEYRGVAEIVNGTVVVELPGYFEAATLPEGRTVHVSVVLPDQPPIRRAEVPPARRLVPPPLDDLSEAALAKLSDTARAAARAARARERQALLAAHDRDQAALDAAVAQQQGDLLPEHIALPRVAASVPRGGRFRISCDGPDGTRVAWLVKAVRADGPPLTPEPLRTDVVVSGDGPYRTISPKGLAA